MRRIIQINEVLKWADNRKVSYMYKRTGNGVYVWNRNKTVERKWFCRITRVDIINYCSRRSLRTSSSRYDFNLSLKVSVLLLVLKSVTIKFQVLAAQYLKNSWDYFDMMRGIGKSDWWKSNRLGYFLPNNCNQY